MLHRQQAAQGPLPHAVPHTYRRNTVLQREGERPARLSLVKHGLLAIRKGRADGLGQAIAVIGPGHLLGQSATFAMPSMFSVQALSTVAVCEFPPRIVQQLPGPPAGTPGFALRHRRMVVSTLADWSRLVRLPSLDQRFAMALRLLQEMQPTRPLLIPSQAVLAELLCVTRESANRAWRTFEARGIVLRRDSRTVDLDTDRLACMLGPMA